MYGFWDVVYGFWDVVYGFWDVVCVSCCRIRITIRIFVVPVQVYKELYLTVYSNK